MHFPTQMSRSADTMSLSDSSPPRYTPYDSTTYLAHVSSASTKAPSSAVEKGIYRSRFVLRLLNVTFAAAAIGSLSLAVRSYNSTKDSFLLWEGKVIWPEGVVMKPSETYFALTGTFLATGSALLLASIWPKIRRLTALGNYLSLGVSFFNFVLALAAVVYFYTFKVAPKSGAWTFWGWTCSNSQIDHPNVTFSLVCAEIRFAWSMGVGVVVAEFLGLALFAAAIVQIRKQKALERTGSFFEKS